MPRPTEWWLHRLTDQLEGWHVWHTSGPPRGWHAVPAPKPYPIPIDPRPDWYLHLPNRVGPFATPQELRTACHQRYGWYDTCNTCGVLALDCGHRQPEQEKR